MLVNSVNFSVSRLPNLDFIRVCLMGGIVFYHSALFWGHHWFAVPTLQTAPTLAFIAFWFNSFHIYGFVFLSGYLFYYLSIEKGKYRQFKSFCVNKVFRLIVPYIFVSACWVIPWEYFFGAPLSTIIPKFVLGISPSQLWFLLMLFGVFILFYISRSITPLPLALISFILSLMGRLIWPNVFQLWNILAFFPFFQLGYYSRSGKVYKYLIPDKVSLLGYAFLQLILFSISHYLYFDKILLLKACKECLLFICHLLGAFTVFHLLAMLASQGKQCSVWKILAASCFGVYLFHQQIIYVILFLTVNKMSPYFITALCFIVAYSLSWGITAILASNQYTAFLIGESRRKNILLKYNTRAERKL